MKGVLNCGSRVKRIVKRCVFNILPSSSALMFHHIDDGQVTAKSGCILKKEAFINIIDSGI